MSTNPNGWLEYGATDDSIVFQHDLKSALTPADIASFGTVLNIGSAALTWDAYGSVLHGHNVTHDATRGMLAKSSADGTTECGYRIDGAGTLLDNGGQITFKVQKEWACYQDALVYSFGDTVAADNDVLSFLPTTGSAVEIAKSSSNGAIYTSGSLASTTNYIHSAGKSDYVTINVGWDGGRVGGKVYVAVDGVLINSGTRNASTLASLAAFMYLGSDRGSANTFCNRYIKDLQISTKPPMFAIHPLLRRVAILSDSIMNSDSFNATYKEAVSSWEMRRVLAKKGIHVGTVELSVNGGYRLDNSLPGSYLHDQFAALLANKPTLVIIRGGTNDMTAQRCTTAGWKAAVAQYLTTGFGTDSVRAIILPNIPAHWHGDSDYDSATYYEQVSVGNSKMAEAASDWYTANPGDTRNVLVPDAFTALGGESPASGTYIGQVDGTLNDLHLSGYGHVLHGRCIAEAITRLLGGQAV